MSLELNAGKDDLRAAFFAPNTRQDIASLLDIPDNRLVYYLFRLPDHESYAVFEIPKKSGGIREIAAPISSLKIIQQKLNQVLQSVYEPKPSVYGFRSQRSILSNARVHAGRKFVFNLDLVDFFPSINFGRVRGMFMGFPYHRNAAVATVLAQICCFNNQLPQGAPTSPVVSNMICAKMDAQLQRLAKSYKCTYTRYADDLTFSTTRSYFPSAIAKANTTGEVEVGVELAAVIETNGLV
jgi:RNA-directed DNA polymerase